MEGLPFEPCPTLHSLYSSPLDTRVLDSQPVRQEHREQGRVDTFREHTQGNQRPTLEATSLEMVRQQPVELPPRRGLLIGWRQLELVQWFGSVS